MKRTKFILQYCAGQNHRYHWIGLYDTFSEVRLKKGETRPFSIKVSWLQSVRSSWPPPDDIIADDVVDKQTFDAMVEMVHVEWQWEQTQYSDVDCNRLNMSYLLSRDLLSFKQAVTTSAQCKNPELDQSYINDLDRVVNYRLDKSYLVLQLSDNAGVMYFIKNEK